MFYMKKFFFIKQNESLISKSNTEGVFNYIGAAKMLGITFAL